VWEDAPEVASRHQQAQERCDAATRCAATHCKLTRAYRAAGRAARKAKKQAEEAPTVEGEWTYIDNMWAAIANDGKGYHDGDGEYTVKIPVEDFGEHFYLGGEARLYLCGGDDKKVFELPSEMPPPGSRVSFCVQSFPAAHPLGRLAMINGMWVRPRA
jgi:hypothetical protein